jgi:hypothetical protein
MEAGENSISREAILKFASLQLLPSYIAYGFIFMLPSLSVTEENPP